MARIIVAGVVNVRVAHQVDAFPVPFLSSQRRRDGISVRLSGTGWTIACTAQRLGSDPIFATYVGADSLGQLAIQGLQERGLYGPTTLVCDAQPRALVLYDRDGRRANTSDLRSVPDLRYPVDVFASAMDSWPACHAAVLTNVGFTRSLIPAAVDRGIPIASDLHLVCDIEDIKNRDWMRVAHILACSHERLPVPPETWIRLLWQRFATEITLVGCGADGAVLGVRSARAIWRIPSLTPRGVTYTSGAGDTLLASFVHHYVTLGDPVAAAQHAVLTAGWKVGAHPDDEVGITSTDLRELRRLHGLPLAQRMT